MENVYRCYRCNVSMTSNVIPYCNTCRTEDALKKQTAALGGQNTTNDQLEQALYHLSQQINNNTAHDQYQYTGYDPLGRKLGLGPINYNWIARTPEEIAENERQERHRIFWENLSVNTVIYSIVIAYIAAFCGVVWLAYKALSFLGIFQFT